MSARPRADRVVTRVRLHLGGAAAMAAAASVLVALAGLVIARYDGFATFGRFVTLQSVGVLLGIPMLWGVHVNASRSLGDPRQASRPEPGSVHGTAVALVTAASLAVSGLFLTVLVGLAAAGWTGALGLWPAAPMGASAALLTLAESLTRTRGHQLRASAARLAAATTYVVVVVVVLTGGPTGDPVLYSLLVAVTNLGASAGLLLPRGESRRRWSTPVARRLLSHGRLFSSAQALLTLLLGFDLVLLAHLEGAEAVAVYALYVTGSRRVVGVLFSDSLASLMIAALSRREPEAGRRLAGRLTTPLLLGAGLGSAVLTVVSLALVGAWSQLAWGPLVLAASGMGLHALVIVLFCVFTIHPALGLARLRSWLTAALVPGLVLQGAGAAVAGVTGMVAAFAVVNLGLAATMVGLVRRA